MRGKRLVAGLAFAAAIALIGSASAQEGPKVVAGPGALPQCFKPWTQDTKYFEWKKKSPPYRVAVANGFVGNLWRIQMIKTAKAYADTPEMKPLIKELKVVSTGTDVAAQVAAVDNFINSGYDAIIMNAVNPTAFAPVIQRANRAGVVLVPFDNALDSDKIMQVNEDQTEMGRIAGRWLTGHVGTKGKILEVRGVPGNSVDRDRHNGFREVMEANGNKFDIIEVVGMWDDGTAQKVTADAIAVHGHFDGIFTQGGSTGTVRALIDAKHPFIPVAGEAENGFRKLCAEHDKEGLVCSSAGQSPGLVAISIKAAVTALQGQPMPQMISVPIPLAEEPNFKDGVNFYSNLTDNFFTPNEFPPCGVTMTATEIMGQSEANQ